MDSATRLSPTSALVLSGVVGHVIFNRLEPRSMLGILSLLIGPPSFLAFYYYNAFYSNTLVAKFMLSYALYLGSLVCSTVAYRLSPFHPLAKYPGPLICKVTRLWALYIATTGNQHHYYKSLHDCYGTHVRTGPNHLCICDAGAIPTILGAKGFPRSERYEVAKLKGTAGNLLTLTDMQEHARRRRVWDRSMNTSAIQGYQEVLLSRIERLISAFEKKRGEVDLSAWLSYFSFDFMGDLAFGSAFNMMGGDSDADKYIRIVDLGIGHQDVIGTIPWIKPIRDMVPGADDLHRYSEFSKKTVLARKANGSTRKDIFYYLLDEEGVGSGPPSLPTLILESRLAIAAGSDTSGTALANLFFYLISHPDAFKRLQAEVDQAFPPGSDLFVPAVMVEMPFLNAVINETLRLWPGVVNGVQRVVPRGTGGAMIAGWWVPERTNLQVPTFSIHRDPRYFSPDPDSFRPERWLGESGFKHDLSAFMPFSHGPMNCAGKGLALQEIRMVTCSLLHKFEFRFAPTWNTDEWEKNLRDSFVLTKGGMPVFITTRQ